MKIVEDILKGILLISLIAVGVLFGYQKMILKDPGVERGEVQEEEDYLLDPEALERKNLVEGVSIAVPESLDEIEWVDYNNEKYVFSLKYPKGWTVVEKNNSIIFYNYNLNKYSPEDYSKIRDGIKMSIYVSEKPVNWTENQETYGHLSKNEIINIDGHEAMLGKGRLAKTPPWPLLTSVFVGNSIYDILMQYEDGEMFPVNREKIVSFYDEILNSIKFNRVILWNVIRDEIPEISKLSEARQTRAIAILVQIIEEDPESFGISSGDVDFVTKNDELDIKKMQKIFEEEIFYDIQELSDSTVQKIEQNNRTIENWLRDYSRQNLTSEKVDLILSFDDVLYKKKGFVNYGPSYFERGFKFSSPDLEFIENNQLKVFGELRVAGSIDEHIGVDKLITILTGGGKGTVPEIAVNGGNFDTVIPLEFGAGEYTIKIFAPFLEDRRTFDTFEKVGNNPVAEWSFINN